MKSIQVNGGGLDNMKIVESPNPTPKAGEILVKWYATSLNFHDYYSYPYNSFHIYHDQRHS